MTKRHHSGRIPAVLLTAVLAGSVFPTAAYADAEPTFAFELTCGGADTVEVSPGDIVTVTLHLRRTDTDAAYTMYAMQDEIRYDDSFFELVEGETVLAPDIRAADIAGTDDSRRFYMNFLSVNGGTLWDADTRVGSIQLRVIAQSGAANVENTNCLVSRQDGTGSFPCTAQDLRVILSTACTVCFMPRGGTEIPTQTVQYGEKIQRPADPVRDGYVFDGWYADIDLTVPWDFDTDTVQSNLTLYAGWKAAPQAEESPAAAAQTPQLPGGVPLAAGILSAVLVLFIIVILARKKKP